MIGAGTVLYKIARSDEKSVSQEDLLFLDTETMRYIGDGTNIDYEICKNVSAAPSGKIPFPLFAPPLIL